MYLYFRNIIDAATLEAHNLEPQEYTDRVKIYSHKLQQQWSQVKYPSTSSPKGLLADLPHPEEILAESPCSMADLQMVVIHSIRILLVFATILSQIFNSFVDKIADAAGSGRR